MPHPHDNLTRNEVAHLAALIDVRLDKGKWTDDQRKVVAILMDEHFDKVPQLIAKREKERSLALGK